MERLSFRLSWLGDGRRQGQRGSLWNLGVNSVEPLSTQSSEDSQNIYPVLALTDSTCPKRLTQRDTEGQPWKKTKIS
jgi:hypothetical protein